MPKIDSVTRKSPKNNCLGIKAGSTVAFEYANGSKIKKDR
jgi:hypothetical protein